MNASLALPDPVTFSPGLQAEDALAAYWIRQATLRLRREICWCWYERGLVSDTYTASLPPFSDQASANLGMSRQWQEKNRFFQTDPTALYLSDQLGAEPPAGDRQFTRGSFGWVTQRLHLDDSDCFILALALADAFDNALGSVIAACLNDPARIHPNLALAQKLWDHPDRMLLAADPVHPLNRYGLVQQGNRSTPGMQMMDWESPIAVSPMVARQLLFPSSPALPALAALSEGPDDHTPLTDDIRRVAARLTSAAGDGLRLVPVRAGRGSSPREILTGVARATQRPIVRFLGAHSLLASRDYVNSLATVCWLRGVDLYLGPEEVSVLLHSRQQADISFLPLESIPITVFWGTTDQSQVTPIPPQLLRPCLDVPTLSYQQRLAHWQKVLGPQAEGLSGVIAECSRRFRYEKETIDAISLGLQELPAPLSAKNLIEACRAEIELNLGELAQKVMPRFEDEELILPPKQALQFHEVVMAMRSLTEVHYTWGTAKAWNESGVSVLCAGPPGTGKTMAAEILAIRLGLPMYRIDLSQVVNKYIGETEKNLKRLFDAADVSDLILFFDEADSLFGRRTEVKDAHDRYANLEISYLLERMERFKGLAILATNRKHDLDEAFLRRIRFIIDFPLPGVAERERIWRQVIPLAVDPSEVDFPFLAKQFPLAGGHIRSIVFGACLQSANGGPPPPDPFKGRLSMAKIIVALKREYDKSNRSVSLEQFGRYAEVVKNMEPKDARNQD